MLLFSNAIQAQINWNLTSSGNLNLTTCYDHDSLLVEFTNISGSSLVKPDVTINLPSGVLYLPGSFDDLSGLNIQESDISNLNAPVFSMDNIPNIGGTVQFKIALRANCEALSLVEGGGVLGNQYIVSHSTGNDTSAISTSYSLRSPSLSFVSVSPSSFSGAVGSTHNQTVVITNGGNGITDSVFLALNPTASLSYASPSLGTMNATNDTIWFIDDGLGPDSLLQAGESITVSYTITLLDCNSLITDLELGWGCDGQNCKIATFPIAGNVVVGSPSIRMVASINHNNWCFGDGPQMQTSRIVNNGNGTATKIIYDQGGYQAAPIDTSTIRYQIGANGPIRPIASSELTLINADIIAPTGWTLQCKPGTQTYYKKFLYNFPDSVNLEANDTLYIYWNTTFCCPNLSNTCSAGTNYFYHFPTASAKDACGNGNYESNRGGNLRTMRAYFELSESPASINTGDSENFDFYFSNLILRQGASGSQVDFQFILPAGLAFDNNVGDLTFRGVAPNSISISGDTVTATYGEIVQITAEAISIKLRGDCLANGGVGGTQTVGLNIIYRPNCPTSCSFRVYCTEASTILLGCGSGCGFGFDLAEASAQRSNFGGVDNDNNRYEDASGTIDTSKLKLNRFLYNDTMEVVINGTVDTNNLHPDFNYLYVEINPSVEFTAIDSADVTIVDQSTGLVYSCRIEATGGPNYVFDANTLCGLPANFKFEKDDSIAFRTLFKLTTNIGGNQRMVEFSASMYVTDSLNPSDDSLKYACNGFDGNFMIVGTSSGLYYDGGNRFSAYGCTSPNIWVALSTTIGRGNTHWFPYEFRSPAIADSFVITLPPTYRLLAASLNGLAITPDIVRNNGEQLRFDTRKYLAAYGGTLGIRSEQNEMRIYLSTAPSCETTPIVFQRFYYRIYAYNSIAETNPTHANWGTYLRHFPPELNIIPVTPTVVATQDTIEWLFRIQNIASNSDASNTFMTIENFAGVLDIIEVIDTTNNTVLNPNAKGIYELGTALKATDVYYKIKAVQTTCTQDSLLVKVGWNCTDYPDTITTYPCTVKEQYLKIQTPPAELQLLVAGPTDSVSMCEVFNYELELTSAQPSNIYDLEAIVDLATGLNYELGSTQIEYPVNSGLLVAADPTIVGNQLRFDLNNYSSKIDVEGLKGTVNADSTNERKVKLIFSVSTDCNFTSGSNFPIRIESQRPCGEALANINHNVTPLVIRGTDDAPYFTQMTTTIDTITSCGSATSYNYEVSILNLGGGQTRSNDQIAVQFPLDVNFISYNAIAAGQRNAPSGQPVSSITSGQNQLTWAMPANVLAGDTIIFRFEIEAAAVSNFCGNYNSPSFTSFTTDVVCIADNSVCSSFAINGSRGSEIVVDRPNLSIRIDSSENVNNGVDNNLFLMATVTNTGSSIIAGEETTVEFFCDTDHSGDYSAPDVLLGDYQTTQAIPNGGSISFIWDELISNTDCDPALGDSIIATFRTIPDNGLQQCACAFGQELRLLPIRLTSFVGKEKDCAIQLDWNSSDEEQLSYFEVQKSSNGFEFETVNKIPAQGKASKYNYLDHNLLQSSNYYRLAMVNANGKRQYTDVLQVNSSCFEAFKQFQFKIYPVPVRDQLNLNLISSDLEQQALSIKIVDLLGQTVLEERLTLKNGIQKEQFDIKNLPAGSYWMQLNIGTMQKQERFIKID